LSAVSTYIGPYTVSEKNRHTHKWTGEEVLGPPTCSHTVWQTRTKFCMVIKLEVRKFFYMVDHKWWRAICLR